MSRLGKNAAIKREKQTKNKNFSNRVSVKLPEKPAQSGKLASNTSTQKPNPVKRTTQDLPPSANQTEDSGTMLLNNDSEGSGTMLLNNDSEGSGTMLLSSDSDGSGTMLLNNDESDFAVETELTFTQSTEIVSCN